jgi:hypothetical protein
MMGSTFRGGVHLRIWATISDSLGIPVNRKMDATSEGGAHRVSRNTSAQSIMVDEERILYVIPRREKEKKNPVHPHLILSFFPIFEGKNLIFLDKVVNIC